MKSHTQTSNSAKEAKLRERCLSWGYPSVCIFAISSLAALSIGSGFQQRTFATVIAFVICCLLLYLIYYTVFLSLPISLLEAFTGKKKEPVLSNIENPEGCEKSEEPQMIANSSSTTEENLVAPEPETAEPNTSSLTFTPELCENQRMEFLKQKEKEYQVKVAYIIQYTQEVMGKLMMPGEVKNLCQEVRNWAEDPKYIPNPVHMLAEADKLDAKHYVWNIAVRLSGSHNSVANRSPFIKALFADMFGTNDLSSMKNLRISPNSGTIKIDEPEPGSYLFAPTEESNKENQDSEDIDIDDIEA